MKVKALMLTKLHEMLIAPNLQEPKLEMCASTTSLD